MNTRRKYIHWRPASLAVLMAASLASPVYAQSAPAQPSAAAISSDALAGAQQVAAQLSGDQEATAEQASESPRDMPRGQFRLPEEGDIIGENYTITVEDPKQTLIDIARRHNIGFEEMRMANPDVSMWVPGEGTEVVIPARYILPPAPREGVVINLSELRLYYYPADNPGIVETYPVSVGREEFSTPVGVTHTTVKVKDPAWAPPQSMRQEAAARGEPAPSVVPAGPDNPLGRHAILLAMPSYLIHGTNRPDGVGMRVSRGCIRMYPEDIESLYNRLPSGTKVNLIDAPFKAGWAADGTLFMQSYPQLEENVGDFEPLIDAIDRVGAATEGKDIQVDYAQVKRAVEAPNGHLVALYGPQAPAAEPEPEEIDSLLDEVELVTARESNSDA